MATQATDERTRVLDELSDVREKIADESDYREFAASSEIDYKLSDARLDGLKSRRSTLKSILRELDD